MKQFLHNAAILFMALLFTGTLSATTYTATASGNWSTMTWSPAGTPGATDDVIIADDVTCTIDAAPTIQNLTVGQGSSGILIFSDANISRNVIITGNILINAGGTFITQPTLTKTHTLAIGGNLTNNGTFDMSRATATLICNVTFNGTGTQIINTTGTPALTRFYKIIMNNTGGYTAPVYPAIAPSITGLVDFQIPISIYNTTTSITFTAGVLKFSSASTITAASFSTVAAASGLWLSDPDASITIPNSLKVDGLLRISAGTLNIGTATTEFSIAPNSNSPVFSTYIFEGGTVNVSGEIKTSSSQKTYYIITGGTLNVATYANTSGSGSFSIGQGNFYMSGGIINLVNPNIGATPKDWSVSSSPTVVTTITGGTLNIGTGSTSNPSSLPFIVNGPCPSLVIDNTGSVKTIKLYATLWVYGDFTVKAGSSLDLAGKAFNIYGNSISVPGNVENHGYIYSSVFKGSYFRFDGSINNNTPQTYIAPDGGKFGFYMNGGVLTEAADSLITISNSGGVTFGADVNVSSLTLSSGLLSIGDNNLTVTGTLLPGSNYVVTNGAGSLIQNVGSTPVIFPVGYGVSDFTPLTFSNGGTAQKYKVRVLPVTPSSKTGALGRQWALQETTPGSTILNSLVLSWNANSDVQSTLVNESPCDVVFNKTGSVDLYDLIQSGITSAASSASITSPFSGLGDISSGLFLSVVQNNSSLPVELSSFTSDLKIRNIRLNWETATEQNCNKFQIQRTLNNNSDWKNIGSVKAAGFSNSPRQYSFTEENLQTGNYQYRLKMIDYDGTFILSKVIEVTVSTPKIFELNQNYPNPFNPSTKISYCLPNDSKVTLDIYSISGEKVGQLVNKEQAAGYYSVEFGSSTITKGLSSGVYLYRIHAVDNSTGKDFSSIKKMILLK